MLICLQINYPPFQFLFFPSTICRNASSISSLPTTLGMSHQRYDVAHYAENSSRYFHKSHVLRSFTSTNTLTRPPRCSCPWVLSSCRLCLCFLLTSAEWCPLLQPFRGLYHMSCHRFLQVSQSIMPAPVFSSSLTVADISTILALNSYLTTMKSHCSLNSSIYFTRPTEGSRDYSTYSPSLSFLLGITESGVYLPPSTRPSSSTLLHL